jgi:two-component system, OmpR family, heavy metal sensor histidine kinase CusS
MRRSLALRIAMGGTLTGLVVCTVAMAVTYAALNRALLDRALAEVEGKRDLAVHLVGEAEDAMAVRAQRHRLTDLLIGHEAMGLAVLVPRVPEPLFAHPGVNPVDAARYAALASGTYRDTGPAGAERIVRIDDAQVRDGTTLRVAVELDRSADAALLASVLRGALIALPVLLLVVAGGAWGTSRAGLAPLQRFASVARSIGSNRLQTRLELSDLPTELRALAIEFNAMLERLEHVVRRLSEFSADLAHEMRTPVATLLGRTQVALARPRSGAALREVLADNVEELERLSRLVTDMLFLASSDDDALSLHPARVDLGALAHAVAEFLGPLAEQRAVAISIAGTAQIRADERLVQRAIINLLTNAIRHSTSPGTVEVSVTCDALEVRLVVTNSGTVIAARDLERVFERFVRLDSARARPDGGSGLGLAIVRSIMQRHGGSVTAASEATGRTTFTLRFPDRGHDALKSKATLETGAKRP